MRVVILYKTSRGLFDSVSVALKNENREKDTDPRSPGFGQREQVQTVSALMADGQYYELKPLHVAQS